MKVITFDCSPRSECGRTVLILAPFVGGMKDEGAEVQLFCTRDLRLMPPEGDFNRRPKTMGRRSGQDDAGMLLPKLQQADVWVFATPVYPHGMSVEMKNLLYRMTALFSPFLDVRDGRSQQSLAEGTVPGKLVLIATCTAWEVDTFHPLLAQMDAYCAKSSRQFAGALLRPHSPALTWLIDRGMPVADIFEAAYMAGRELAGLGQVSAETSEIVSRQLLPLDLYIQFLNERLQERLAAQAPQGGRPRPSKRETKRKQEDQPTVALQRG